MAQIFPLHFLLLLLVTTERSSGNLFDLEDAVYSFLVTNCSNSERLATYDITGDNKTRGLKAGETIDTHPPVKIKVGPVRYGSAQVQSLQLSAVYDDVVVRRRWLVSYVTNVFLLPNQNPNRTYEVVGVGVKG
uniref:Putative cytotoxin-like protein n=1 Tax=Ixodes ricinus TaxID=34613 RepID=A0A0K8RJL3_IXORI